MFRHLTLLLTAVMCLYVLLINNTKTRLINFITACGNRYYTCSSTTSMDDCEGRQIESTDCPTGFNHCAKLTQVYGSVKSFTGGCQAKAACDNSDTYLKVCKAFGGTCSLDCCRGDLCNSGTAPVISVSLMIACAPLSGKDAVQFSLDSSPPLENTKI